MHKVKFFCVIAIIVITVFIPVKSIHSIEYTYPKNNRNDILDMGSTTYIYSYKNLYGLTLKTNESVSQGMYIY